MTMRAALVRETVIAGWLLVALAASLLLHATLYHTSNPTSGSVFSGAAASIERASSPVGHHRRTPREGDAALAALPAGRCPLPEVIATRLVPIGPAALVAAELLAPGSEPAIRYLHGVGIPERPPWVMLQQLRL